LTRKVVGADALRAAQQNLARISGVREVRTNQNARSLLVVYDATSLNLADLMRGMAGAGITVASAPPNAKTETEEQGAALAGSITNLFEDVDRRVANLTGGKADLRTLLPVGLGALALREVVAGRAGAVPWYVLLWYAFDSFIKLGRPRTPSDDQA
jgi:hypothetical protein